MNAFTPVEPMVDAGIDPKLAWLACAAARFELVEAGAMDIDDGFRRPGRAPFLQLFPRSAGSGIIRTARKAAAMSDLTPGEREAIREYHTNRPPTPAPRSPANAASRRTGGNWSSRHTQSTAI